MKPNITDSQTWLDHRLALLKKEKEFTKLRDELSRARREMPWVKVDKPYQFSDIDGNYSLFDLFNGKSQLIVYHFMYGNEWGEPCKSCSFWADNFNGIEVHLAHRDIAFMAISSATVDKLEAFKQRMGWSFRWLSSGSSDFNQDFHVTFTDAQRSTGEIYHNYKQQPWFIDELVGVSVFAKDTMSCVYHTYSTYSRGIDILNSAYNFMDLTPKGRDEADGIMNWLRIRDQYD